MPDAPAFSDVSRSWIKARLSLLCPIENKHKFYDNIDDSDFPEFLDDHLDYTTKPVPHTVEALLCPYR
jgi:hypothetical protein